MPLKEQLCKTVKATSDLVTGERYRREALGKARSDMEKMLEFSCSTEVYPGNNGDKEIAISLNEFFQKHVHSENQKQFPYPDNLQAEVAPVMNWLFDTLTESNISHFIRSSTITDLLSGLYMVGPLARAKLKYIMNYDHFPELRDYVREGSFEDQVCKKLREGPDLDMVVEKDPLELRDLLDASIEQYYQQNNPVTCDVKGWSYLGKPQTVLSGEERKDLYEVKGAFVRSFHPGNSGSFINQLFSLIGDC